MVIVKTQRRLERQTTWTTCSGARLRWCCEQRHLATATTLQRHLATTTTNTNCATVSQYEYLRRHPQVYTQLCS